MKRENKITIIAYAILFFIVFGTGFVGAKMGAAAVTQPEAEVVYVDSTYYEESSYATGRYADIVIGPDDMYALACLVYHEARGESFDGQVAVAEVVLNRVLSSNFPDTIQEVIFANNGTVWQFTPAKFLYEAEPTRENFAAVYTAIYQNDYVLPQDVVFFGTSQVNGEFYCKLGSHYFGRE